MKNLNLEAHYAESVNCASFVRGVEPADEFSPPPPGIVALLNEQWRVQDFSRHKQTGLWYAVNRLECFVQA